MIISDLINSVDFKLLPFWPVATTYTYLTLISCPLDPFKIEQT